MTQIDPSLGQSESCLLRPHVHRTRIAARRSYGALIASCMAQCAVRRCLIIRKTSGSALYAFDCAPPPHPLRRRQWKILAHISGTWSTGHLGLRCLEGRQHTAQHHRRLLRQVNTWVGRPTCRRPTSTCPADTWRIPTLPPHLSIPWHTCHTQQIPRLTPHTCSE